MKFLLNGNIRRRTNMQLLEDLKSAARKMGKDTLSFKQYSKAGAYSPSAIVRRFGTWNKALIKAGLTVTRHQGIAMPALFANLRDLWLRLGRQPSLSDLHPPYSRFGRKPYLRVFGKWSIALKKFVAYADKHPVWRTRSARHGENPHAGSIRSAVSKKVGARRYITWRLRYLTMKRDNFRCRACGASPATNPAITLHVDHVIPLSKGGEAAIENLQTLCSVCNIGKSNL